MFIKMEYIQKYMEGKIVKSHIPNDSNLSFYMLYEETTHEFEENVLYICVADDISEAAMESIRYRSLNFIIFAKGDCNLDYLESSNYILVNADLSGIFAYINELSDVFKLYRDWELKLLKLISSGGTYQEAIEIGNEMLPTPMAIMDINHQVMAISKECESEDTLLFSLSNGYGYQFLNIINRSNPTLDEVDKDGVCEVINSISGKRLRVYKIRNDARSPYFIGFHKADDKPFHPADVSLFDFFVLYLEKLVRIHEKNQNCNNDVSLLLTNLITNSNVTKEFLEESIAYLNISAANSWKLLCIKFTSNLQFRTTYHYKLIKEFQQVIPDSYCALIHSDLAILVKSSLNLDDYLNKLQYLLVTNDALCACSSTYVNLSQTSQVWKQLQFMLKRRPIGSESNVLFYSDYYYDQCLETLNEELPKKTLYHTALYKIEQFDTANHTNYLATLICYLQNNCSMNATATILDIHRNSLLYRIQKVEEILGFEIASSDQRLAMLLSSYLITK